MAFTPDGRELWIARNRRLEAWSLPGDLMQAMLEALSAQPEGMRMTMAVARMEAMAALAEPQRRILMRTMEDLSGEA